MLKYISYGFLVGLLAVFNAADAALTHIGLSYGFREMNPIIASLIDQLGIGALYAYKICMYILILYLVDRYSRAATNGKKYLILANAALFLVILNNIMVLRAL